ENPAEGGRRWFLISDGLSTVSVYVEPDQGHGFTGAKRVGAMNAAGRILDGHQITVVGEAPLPTVQAIADALGSQP
ncbi:MAG: MucB/RseB C-terminal domain-containing protein, partial [Halochromatium sp.]